MRSLAALISWNFFSAARLTSSPNLATRSGGNIIAQDSFPTQDHPSINEFIAFLSYRLMQIIEANGGYETIRSVGVGVLSGNCSGKNLVHQ